MSRREQAAKLLRLAGELIDLNSKRKERESKDRAQEFEALAVPFMDAFASNIVQLDELTKYMRDGKFKDEVDKYKRAGSKIAAKLRAMKRQYEMEAKTKTTVTQ